MYKYYRIEKQEIFCTLLMLPLCLAVVPFSCSFFQKFVSPTVPNLDSEISECFFCSITFKNIQIFLQNSIFVAETHVYTKP